MAHPKGAAGGGGRSAGGAAGGGITASQFSAASTAARRRAVATQARVDSNLMKSADRYDKINERSRPRTVARARAAFMSAGRAGDYMSGGTQARSTMRKRAKAAGAGYRAPASRIY